MRGSSLYGSPMKRKSCSPAKHGTTMDFSYGRNGHHPDKMEASHEDLHRAQAERQEKLQKQKKKPSPAKADVRKTIGPGKNFNKAKSTGTGAAAGGGMTQKGVDSYKAKNPGSKLKTAVTTPPSQLKKGSKAAGRRKSFCARSASWDGPRGKAARRRWNC
jgi:hypothetical protein